MSSVWTVAVPARGDAAAGAAPAVLPRVLHADILPALLRRHRSAANDVPVVAVDERAPELARLVIAAEPQAAVALVDDLRFRAPSIAHLCTSLLEPTARLLGDLWDADDCSDSEVTLGLCRLQGALRRADAVLPPRRLLQGPARCVLVAPLPGESHMFGPAIATELFWRAGWNIRCEFPETDEALCRLLADQWFDTLDLSLSVAFRRVHWLPRLVASIAGARSASRNPALVVLSGGRVFGEPAAAGMRSGADGSYASALQLERLMPRRPPAQPGSHALR